jgi:hypothetical protein
MRRLWLGMLLAFWPLALPAQILDQRPWRNDAFAPAPARTDEHVAPMPPARTITVAPAPAYDPSIDARPDDSVTAAPLPPPDSPGTAAPLPPQDNTTDNPAELVPNPLDNPSSQPAPATTKQAQQPQGQPERGGWVPMGSATLQALDKVNAIGKTLVVKVGDTGHFDSLDIAVRGCFVRTSDRPADATAFLVIRDHRTDAPSFTGWMVRSAPSLSMMAHPIYDVRVAACSP